MATIRLNEVDQEVSDLLTDAANRVGMKKHAYIISKLKIIAGKEYAQQQNDSSED